MSSYHNLNKQQQSVVDHIDGPLLVVAGAGSGKTMAITYRIANLIKSRIAHPDQILGVTFTNKAAKEMKHRVNNLASANVFISTFHSFCAIVLRQHIDRFGYNSTFSIYDESDQIGVIRDIITGLNLCKDQFKPKDAAGKINRLKEDLIDENMYQNYVGNFYEENISKIYKEYQSALKNNNAVDFADLIRLTVRLFEREKDILNKYQEKYRYILVDEYQDTNYSQYKLINTIANKYKNLCVVGDPDQSIYSWRGADISNIMNFEKDYPDAKVINLEQNYRSTEIILDSANKVIEKNVNRMPKNLLATRPGGNKIIYYSASDSKDEADFICQKIKETINNGEKYSDIAILYRMHALSRSLEEKLMANNIPYEVIGGIKFYDRKEIKDILAYLSFLMNSSDRVAFQRIINIPKRAIGPASVSSFLEYCDGHQCHLHKARDCRRHIERFCICLIPLCKNGCIFFGGISS